eukprot:6190063-Pleurochrysis_carterae.AAC.2
MHEGLHFDSPARARTPVASDLPHFRAEHCLPHASARVPAQPGATSTRSSEGVGTEEALIQSDASCPIGSHAFCLIGSNVTLALCPSGGVKQRGDEFAHLMIAILLP